ncbi:MAG: UvrD-helicase domain-containing protein, partial [Firmicutes bacterium]|nr:UvrD-helicase domain-containing protein [Candidatus Caballimonas caccae]
DFINCKKISSFIYCLTRKFKDEFTRLKLEDNYLDFNDIEHYAIKIIEDENILKSLQEKYKYIFIDEYQDVNATQEYIITRLSKNNLFMVGDEKQSIYGFRGCVPEFFQDKFVKMQNEGEKTVLLNTNFRSAKAVIDGVNQVFSYCMTEDRYGLNYKEKAKLILCDNFNEHYGRARLDLFVQEKPEKIQETPRIYNIREEALKETKDEDDITVSMLYSIIKEELTKEFYDANAKVVRKVQPKDIAILCRAKSGNEISSLIKGLTMRGLNITSTSEEDICDYPEVISCINFLRLVDCFYQSVPLVSVLKSNIVGLDENDLCLIVEFFKDNVSENEKINRKNFTFVDAFFYYLEHAETELKDRLNDFFNYIQKIHLVSYYKTAGEILEEVINDFSILSYYYAEKDGEIKVKRIERLISFCNENVKSIQSLLKIVDDGKNKITIAKGGNEDAIKFITMHSSKGLEFPVVIACKLNKKFNEQDKKNGLIFDRNFGLASKVFDNENRVSKDGLLRKVFKIRYDEKIEKEEMRLFYVALTRATYSLHMQAIVKKDNREIEYKGTNGLFGFIPSTFETKNYTLEELNNTEKIKSNGEVILSQTTEEGIKKVKDNLEFKYKYLEDTCLPLKSNVTEANKSNVESIDCAYLFNDSELEKNKKEQGIIAHKIMQYYDFSDSDFIRQISLMKGNNIITEEELKEISLDKIEKVICSPLFSSFKWKKVYREKPFI